MRSSILIALALVACTSNTTSVSVTGMPLGSPFSARDAIVVQEPGPIWVLVITDYDNACTRYPSVASSEVMTFMYLGPGSPSAQAYTGIDGTPWDVQSLAFDAGCIQSDDASGSGTMSLASVTPDATVGNFDLVFSTANGEEHVTGEFTATACQLPATAGTSCR